MFMFMGIVSRMFTIMVASSSLVGGSETLHSDSTVHRFHKLGFCSVSFNATLALVGKLWKTILHASISGVPMSTFPIHTCKSQWHAILLFCLVFFSQTENHQVSLNDIFMQLSTRHNSTNKGLIDKKSTPLVSWHAITSSGPSPPRLHGPVTSMCIGFVN